MPIQSRSAWLQVEQYGEVAIVKFQTRSIVDREMIRTIDKQLASIAEQTQFPKIVLNFAGVHHMSSEMLAALLNLHRKMQEVDGRVVLCGIAPQVSQVFKITQLDKTFGIYANEPDALQSF